MVLGRALTWTAERFPDRPAIGGERSFTYAEWDARTNQIARALGTVGAKRGERVALSMANGEQLAACHLAGQKLGALSTPLNVRFAPDELAYCLEDAAPVALVSDDSTAELVRDALERLHEADRPFEHLHVGADGPSGARPFEALVDEQPDHALDVRVERDDPSVMLYTAGTTGRPKGVPRSQLNEWSAALAHVVQAGYQSGESTLLAMPLYHTMGMRSLLSMILVGGKVVPMARFRAEPALELIESEHVSALYLVPTAFWSLLQEGDLAAAGRDVRKVAFAGAAMTSTLCEELGEALSPAVFVNHYGSTEVYTFAIEEDAAARPGSAGRAGINSRLRLVHIGEEGAVSPDDEVAPGQVGEFIASLDSPEAFSGYWQRPDADERAIHEGWYYTGDLGVVHDDGRYRVAGRVDDMIISGGENVHPLEVEDVLIRSPHVADVAVAGLEDDRWGQAVTAFIVPADDASEPEREAQRVAEWVREESGLTAYKRPKRVVVVDAVPKSPVGKVLRRQLVAGEYEARGEAGAAGKDATR